MALTETDIKIIIAAELKKQGFDKAQKATSGLEKSFKKLGLAVTAAFSVQQVVAFGKASLKAFEEDQKAATRLAQTLKNLGLGFEDPRIQTYIANLERTSGVLDDQLRPALQSLLTTTGSVTTSQKLLATAIDVSRGSGEDLVTVANDLAQAYVGNTKGLKKYNLGLTQTELKGKSFNDLMTILNSQFAGQNAAYLETYAGKMDALNVAFANAQETIGKGLADAFILLAGDNGIGAATSAMEEFAQKTSDAIVGVATLINKLNTSFPTLGGKSILETLYAAAGGGFIDALAKIGKEQRIAPKPFATPMSISGATDTMARQDAARKKAEADAAKRAKALAALQTKVAKDQLAKEKATQQLKRAGTVFDMENIQIVAALQGKVTEEQRLRLLALLAINNDMADAADKLTQAILAVQSPAFNMLGITITASDNATTVVEKLIKAQTQLLLVSGGIADIPKAKNPFEDWDKVMKSIIDNLDTISKKIKELPTAPGTSAKTETTTTTVIPIIPVIPGGGVPGGGVPGGDLPGYTGYASTSTFPGDISVLTGSTIDALIADAYVSATMGGYGNTSLTSSANVLSSARLSAQLLAIQTQNKQTNDLAAARLEGQYQAIASLNKQTNDLAAARYAAMQRYYAPQTTPNVVVNVAGSVSTERDLVTTFTDALYEFQRSGGDIRLSAVAI